MKCGQTSRVLSQVLTTFLLIVSLQIYDTYTLDVITKKQLCLSLIAFHRDRMSQNELKTSRNSILVYK